MLSLKYILKVNRMMYQTEGYSPGAYDIHGQDYNRTNDTLLPAISKNPIAKQGKRTVKLRLDYVIDEATGDIRLVQK